MNRILRTLLFLPLMLAACTPGDLTPVPPDDAPPAATESPTDVIFPVITRDTLSLTKLPGTIPTPHIQQGPDGAITYPEGCGYRWARRDLPDLSASFLQSLQALQPEAQGNAYAYGEDCLGADGNILRFIPLETDFNITLQVTDLSNETQLGEWIVQVMQIIESMPPAQLVGPKPGLVHISFQSVGQQSGLGFYRDQYQALPAGLPPAEIYQRLNPSP